MASSRISPDAEVRRALAAHGLLDSDVRIAVAYSGGLDSTVLLNACVDALGASRVLALHVDHGLQSASSGWAMHCGQRAGTLGVAFRALRLGAFDGGNLEAWARRERYTALWTAAEEEAVAALLTAHHANDQAETLLMSLARGAGLDGLAGIASSHAAPAAAAGGARPGAAADASSAAPEPRRARLLLRPLLRLTRSQLERAARARGLDWVEDPTNAAGSTLRAGLRTAALPAIERVLPRFTAAAARSVELLQQARAELDEYVAIDLQRAARGSAELDRSALAQLSSSRKRLVVRAWLAQLALPMPSQRRLDQILAQLVDGESAHGLVMHAGCALRRYRDRVIAAGAEPEVDRRLLLRWDGEPELGVAGFGRLAFDAVPSGEGVSAAWLRARELTIVPATGRLGLRLRADGPRRTLKNLHQEAGTPAWARRAHPAVLIEGRLLFAAPFGMDRDAAWPRDGSNVALRWLAPV